MATAPSSVNTYHNSKSYHGDTDLTSLTPNYCHACGSDREPAQLKRCPDCHHTICGINGCNCVCYCYMLLSEIINQMKESAEASGNQYVVDSVEFAILALEAISQGKVDSNQHLMRSSI